MQNRTDKRSKIIVKIYILPITSISECKNLHLAYINHSLFRYMGDIFNHQAKYHLCIRIRIHARWHSTQKIGKYSTFLRSVSPSTSNSFWVIWLNLKYMVWPTWKRFHTFIWYLTYPQKSIVASKRSQDKNHLPPWTTIFHFYPMEIKNLFKEKMVRPLVPHFNQSSLQILFTTMEEFKLLHITPIQEKWRRQSIKVSHPGIIWIITTTHLKK